MNLWAKRIGQLAVLPIALFFFACEDEASLLGYKNPNSKFEVRFIEIPLESSVLLLDSQRTSNYLFEGETNRFLIGKYVDPKFGTTTAGTFAQYFTTAGTKLEATATFDSVSLQLYFDLYTYGAKQPTLQTISAYEVDEDLTKGTLNYFNTTEVAVKPDPLGSKTFSIDPALFEDYFEILTDGNSANDTLVSPVLLRMPLNNLFGARLFQSAKTYSTATSVEDSAFVKEELFMKDFKGIAFKSEGGDKIMGFDPLSTSSVITLHYHTDTKEGLKLNLGFFGTASFNQIKTDRSASELAGLNQSYVDFYPANDLRYIQGATSVYTKVDFSNFFAFADTVPNLLINSAELIIANVEQSDYAISSNLSVRLLNTTNRFHIYDTAKVPRAQDSLDLTYYNPRVHSRYPGSIMLDQGDVGENDLAFVARGDERAYLAYSSNDKSFNGNYALFFQQLTVLQPDKRRFSSALLYPTSPAKPATKTLNRTVFPKSGIKLRVYYTKPTLPLN